MHQQDWQEYFEAVNGRPATAQEIQTAIAQGEITVPQAQSPVNSQAAEPAQAAPANPTVAQQAPVNQAPQGFQADQAYYQQGQVPGQVPGQAAFGQNPYGAYQKPANPVGKAFADFFKWFGKGFYKPEATDTESHPVFGLITTAVTALIGAGLLRNTIVDAIAAAAGSAATSFGSYGASLASGTAYRYVAEALGVGVYFIFALLLLLGYAGPIALGRILKDAAYPTDNYWQRLGRAFGYMPMIFALNLFGLLISFFGGNSFVVAILVLINLFIFLLHVAAVAIGANQGLGKLTKGLTTLLTLLAVTLILLLVIYLASLTIQQAGLSSVQSISGLNF